ncbi:DUF1684 domain-containing protein [Leucobacter sp. W1478]|uniref:DUF1684 domain-containing protein n=1 Tax=Leucobacter sp. W1478 TaxID=3439065 RepID=UPI003F3F9A05
MSDPVYPPPAQAEFEAAHARWHAEVERSRTSPYGPLSVTALHWLSAEPQVFQGVPGKWSAGSNGLVTVHLEASDRVTQGEKILDGAVQIGPLAGIDSTTLVWGEQQLELAARSGRIVLRPRDPQSKDRVEYAGTYTFPPKEQWVVTARFVPAPREAVQVDSAAGPEAKQHYDSPGSAEFEVEGTPVALTLFGEPNSPSLRAIFADATGVDLTFPAARFVGVTQTGDDTLVIDFNRSVNPPCAYSESATCPFPPPENRLAVRIEAGELRPGVNPPYSPQGA